MIFRHAPRRTYTARQRATLRSDRRQADCAAARSHTSHLGLLRPAVLGLGLVTLTTSGCFRGEWRTGPEYPVATTTRLLPTRTVETWELSQTLTPYVVQVKGTQTPRCRHALYGRSQRTDTGKFERIGGNWWAALAISAGIAGGASAGFGAAGWYSQLDPTLGRYVMYGGGGALAAGGLASCFAALARGTTLRYTLCGLMTGLGASVLGGAFASSLYYPGMAPTVKDPVGVPLISTPTFQTLTVAGGGIIAGAVVSGILASIWRGFDDRARVVNLDNSALWDQQQGETTCGQVTALSGRAMGLDVVTERAGSGLGTEVQPLKIRVVVGNQSTQTVDLQGLRAALPSCGALRVTLNPDVLYEQYTDDYMPPVSPAQVNLAAQPMFGQVVPRDGLVLPVLEAKQRVPAKSFVPGISAEVLASVERSCRGEAPAKPATTTPDFVRHPTPAGSQTGTDPEPAVVVPPPVEPGPVVDLTPRPPEDTYVATPGLSPQRRSGQADDGECGFLAQRIRITDCEHQCGKAHQLTSCVFDFRKCQIEARSSTQPQRERDLCDLAWEQCLIKGGISTSTWRRCVEGCAEVAESPSCREPVKSNMPRIE